MPEGKSLSPAVNRAVAVLEELAREAPLGTSELARRLELPKSSIANILQAMDQTGLIERVDQSYGLGRRLVEFASAYLAENAPADMFLSAAQDLPRASDETVVFAELAGPDIVYLARHHGSQPVRLAGDIGNRMPAVATALGQAMLSQLEGDELEVILGQVQELPRLTKNSYQTMDAVRAALRATAERGYARDDELNTEGVVCFSVPCAVGASSNRRFAVSVTMLKARHSEELERALVADLQVLAKALPLL
jgi:DNA-binding IclR family transcriptional regulator